MSLFTRYEGSPGSTRGAASRALDQTGRYRSLGVDATSAGNAAAGFVSGLLPSPVKASVAPLAGRAHTLSQAATVAGGAMNLFAQGIDDYNTGIDALNREYEQARAANFNVSAEPFFMGRAGSTPEQKQQAYDQAVQNADSALQAELRRRRDALEDELDHVAQTAATMLDTGPDAATVQTLAIAGMIPMDVALNYPGVDVDLVKEMVKAGGVGWKVWSKIFTLGSKIDAARLAVAGWRELNAGMEMFPFVRNWGELAEAWATLDNADDYMGLYTKTRTAEALAAAKGMGLPITAFGKGMAGLGIGMGIYDIVANPQGHTGVRRGIDIGMDVVGIGASGAGLAVAAGLISVTPVGAAVILTAGAVTAAWAAGSYIYDHWDDITHGASVAADWVGDQASQAWEGAQNVASDVGDWASDQLPDIDLPDIDLPDVDLPDVDLTPW